MRHTSDPAAPRKSQSSRTPVCRPARGRDGISEFFSVNEDLVKLREGVRMARRATVQAPLDPYRGDEINTGVHVDSDDAIDDWIRETMVTAHHPACTCAMGVGELSVFNPDMTVRGAQSLRVVDASAMPDLTSGNINAPVLMMAEKASGMILGNFSTG